MHRVLLVENNLEYANKLKRVLLEKQQEVLHVQNPIVGIEEFAKGAFDLVISNYKMAEMDGVRFLSTIKNIKPEVKSMLLTEFATEEIEMAALDISVDKCLSKDRSFVVLVKHMEQLLEGQKVPLRENSTRLVSKQDNIVLDCKSHIVYKNNAEILLTRKEFDLLHLFLQNKGVALSREEIVDKLWTKDVEEVDIRIVDGHIKKLRSKLQSFSIMSVRGYGYKWNEE